MFWLRPMGLRSPAVLSCVRMMVNFLVRIGLWLALALSAVPGLGFVPFSIGGGYLRWHPRSPLLHANIVNPATGSIRYYVAMEGYSAANRTNEIDAVRACFDQWQNIAGSNLRFEFAGLILSEGLEGRLDAPDNTNVVFWARRTLPPVLNGRRAWTAVHFADDGTILEADIVLNGVQFSWFTEFTNFFSAANQAQFVEGVALHEIGHFVGLDHSPAGGATVANGASGIGTEAGLSADEVAAMRFLYPVEHFLFASVTGVVRVEGAALFGAMVTVEDAAGNIAGATVTSSTGAYEIASLATGNYLLRVSPLDPANSGHSSLLRAAEIAPEYAGANTSFLASTNVPLALTAGERRLMHDIAVRAGSPPFRIQTISPPERDPILFSSVRRAVWIHPGQSNQWIAVASPAFRRGATLAITGDGLTVGETQFLENRFPGGLHALAVPVSVSSNATPGLRSFVVSHENSVAYANGYLEVLAPVPDFNFDQLDDRFQRKHWRPWTSPESRPLADPDGDLFSNRFEFRLGTNPIDRSSHSLMLRVERSGTGSVLHWPADQGRQYQLFESDRLEAGSWRAAGIPITAGSEAIFQPIAPGDGAGFFRVQILP